MSNLNLPICPRCGGTARWARSVSIWRCQYCPQEFSDAEAKTLTQARDLVTEVEHIIDVDDLLIFKRPAEQAPIPDAPPQPVAASIPLETIVYAELINDEDIPIEVVEEVVPPLEVHQDVELPHQIDTQDIADVHDIDGLEMFMRPKAHVPETRPPRFKMPDLSPQKQSASSEASTGSSMYFSLREGK